MPTETVSVTTFEKPDFFSAMLMLRRRRRKVEKIKRGAGEISYLNIVAMMDMMTIILVFLLKSVSFATVTVSESDAMTLPYSTTQVEPVEAIKVFVTKNEITVEETKVAEVENGMVVAKYLTPSDSYSIVPLKKLLDEKARRLAILQKRNPQTKVQDNLTILADQDTPYFVIMQVLVTASRASGGEGADALSFGTFRLTVLKKET
jgi:biopolymer transport protein ExbD